MALRRCGQGFGLGGARGLEGLGGAGACWTAERKGREGTGGRSDAGGRVVGTRTGAPFHRPSADPLTSAGRPLRDQGSEHPGTQRGQAWAGRNGHTAPSGSRERGTPQTAPPREHGLDSTGPGGTARTAPPREHGLDSTGPGGTARTARARTDCRDSTAQTARPWWNGPERIPYAGRGGAPGRSRGPTTPRTRGPGSRPVTRARPSGAGLRLPRSPGPGRHPSPGA